MNQVLPYGVKQFRWAIGIMAFFLMIVPNGVNAKDLVRFGVLPVVDTLPLLVGQESGFFDKENIKLELINFQSALERDAALQAGRLDGYFGDILNTVLLIQTGQPIKIITTAFHSHPDHRMFGVVAAPNAKIKTFSDLRKKPVAISRSTIIEYLLDRMLQARGLSADFVEKYDIKKIPIRLQMLLSDKVPAALLPEPLLTLAESKGAKVLEDDRLINTCLTVLALDLKKAEQIPDLSIRFLRAYGQAVDEINQHPESFKELLIRRTRFPEPIKDKYLIPVFPNVSVPSTKDIADAQKWLKANGSIKNAIDYDRIVLKE